MKTKESEVHTRGFSRLTQLSSLC